MVPVQSSDTPTSWTDPAFVSTVVGTLATGALVFYAALARPGLTVDEVVFVVLTVTLPAAVAYEIARRRS